MRRRPEDSTTNSTMAGKFPSSSSAAGGSAYGSGAYYGAGGPTNRGGNPYARPDTNAGARSAEASRLFYEEENNRKIAELSSQVSMLKELTIDIGTEVRTQNSLLDDMGGGFSRADGLMGSTMRRLGTMLNATSSRHMLWMVGFIVFVFFFVYYIVRNKSTA